MLRIFKFLKKYTNIETSQTEAASTKADEQLTEATERLKLAQPLINQANKEAELLKIHRENNHFSERYVASVYGVKP